MDDWVGQSALITCEHWPALVDRYDSVSMPLWGSIVSRRLIDWQRIELGRRRQKPEANSILLSHMLDGGDAEGLDWDIVDPVDVEDEALDLVMEHDLDETIGRLVLCVPEAVQWRVRTVCEMLAGGATLAQVGAELGCTESRACQIVQEIREWARDHPMSPLAA